MNLDIDEGRVRTPTSAPRAYFAAVAVVVATRATCDRRHVGAVFVRDKTILSTGYNGSLPGQPHCDDAGHIMEDGHCVRVSHAEPYREEADAGGPHTFRPKRVRLGSWAQRVAPFDTDTAVAQTAVNVGVELVTLVGQTPWSVYVERVSGRHYRAMFSVGVQNFTLRDVEDDDEAEAACVFMAAQFCEALARAGLRK